MGARKYWAATDIQVELVSSCKWTKINNSAFQGIVEASSCFPSLMSNTQQMVKVSFIKEMGHIFTDSNAYSVDPSPEILSLVGNSSNDFGKDIDHPVYYLCKVWGLELLTKWKLVQTRTLTSTSPWFFCRRTPYFSFIMTWEWDDRWRRTKNVANQSKNVWSTRVWGKNQVK